MSMMGVSDDHDAQGNVRVEPHRRYPILSHQVLDNTAIAVRYSPPKITPKLLAYWSALSPPPAPVPTAPVSKR